MMGPVRSQGSVIGQYHTLFNISWVRSHAREDGAEAVDEEYSQRERRGEM